MNCVLRYRRYGRYGRYACSALALVGAFALAVPRLAPAKPVFSIPEDSLRGRFHRIAFATSVASYSADSARDSTAVGFELLLASRLTKAGFEVVAPSVGPALGRRLVDSLGGLFDPKTGAIDSARAGLVRSRVIAALQDEHGADGILYWRIVQVKAAFSSGTAHWDETKEKMETKSFLGKIAGPSYRGTVPAYSILVVIDDRTGRSLYMHRVGIAVGATLQKGKFADRPAAESLGDPERNAVAVDKALAPFCKAVGKDSEPSD